MKSLLHTSVLLLLSFVLVACFGGGGGGSATTYSIGGTVTGLEGTGLVLQNNGGDDIAISADSSFTFATALANAGSYSVTVLTQPSSPNQICTIANGNSTVSDNNITNVSVTCVTNTYTIEGSVTGLSGSGLVLQNNGADSLPIADNGSFTFATAITDGTGYNVTVLTQPTGQVCPVTGGSGTLSGADVTDITVTCLTPLGDVTALYSFNGANWNDYVVDDGASFALATDTACFADTDTACLHAGELRVFEVTGNSSCTGLTGEDRLGVFDWICDASTGTARFISTGLKVDKGLSDLMNFTTPGWKDNSLTIYDGADVYGTSSSTAWWANPVVANTTGGALSTAGLVYVVPSNTVATAYEFTASNVALVAAPGVVINGSGSGSSVISATGMDFLWLEGMTINATGDNAGVYWDTVRFSTMQGLTAGYADTGSYMSGIRLLSSSKNTLSNIIANNNADVGVWLWTSSDNMLSGVIASNNYYGVRIYWLSNNNTLSDVTAINNSWIGVHLSDSSNNNLLTNIDASGNEYGVDLFTSSNNWLTDVTASNNSYGVTLCSSLDNTFTGVTASNNGTWGVGLNCSSNNNTLTGVTASNNGHSGIVLWPSSSNNTLSNVTANNNNDYGLILEDSSNNYFTGELQVGNNFKDCDVSDGTNPGLVDSTCANDGASDATLTTGITIADSFVAKVFADDSANTSDTGGAATITDLTQAFDWTSFENTYRAWGVDGSTFPDTTNRGKLGCSDPYPNPYTNQTDCEAISGTWTGDARIWDWSLLSTDTVIKDVLTLPTGNDTLTHTWSDTSTSTILRNAVEIQDDGIGNDNTLCETNETCLYTPNIGSYQGHGNLISAGSIGTGGTLENIILMKYETNGY